MNLNKGIFYQSTVSGMWYKTCEAAGEISCVLIDAVKFYPIIKGVDIQDHGLISFEQEIKQGGIKGDFGIQIAKDGRVWICVDGQALIRFKPLKENILKENKK